MPKTKPKKEAESERQRWDEHAKTYDDWYKTFRGAVEHTVDWQLLKPYLPRDRNAKVLDAAGGTGRITLPLAKMGYKVTLCDISPEMLKVAKRKIRKAKLQRKVSISECDVRKLRYPDETFDLVICWDGHIEAAKELVRVTKKGGTLSIYLMNKYGLAINKFAEDPDSALAMLKQGPSTFHEEKHQHTAVAPEEALQHFKKIGIQVKATYAICGTLKHLNLPEKTLNSHKWNTKLFNQTAQMLQKLAKEPSTKGLARHLVLYGTKT